MKYIFCLLIIIFSVNAFSGQNKTLKIYVEYAVMKGSINTVEYLIADANNALYTTEIVEITNNEIIKKEGDNQYSINPAEIKINAMKYYTKSDSPTMYFVSQPKNIQNTIVAIDSLPDISWKLNTNESKILNTFKCYKAEGTFRGSEIIAYYTPEIPIVFGPFKFKGLPGLIMEVYNDDNGLQYHWKASKIIIPFKQDIDLKFLSESYNSPIVTYRSIVEKFENKLKQMDQTMKTRVSRGGSIKLNNTERVSIEKIYEWEKETKED
ncbi:GLPGLI family protein [Psychroflexus gondwanensis]|nr:GLPGLI family protein [Psychroflexus gondwanensis]